ncbi:MAG: hypothetical protein V7L14_09015 [Nostoc sp.]
MQASASNPSLSYLPVGAVHNQFIGILKKRSQSPHLPGIHAAF